MVVDILFVLDWSSICEPNVVDKKIVTDSPTRLFFAELRALYKNGETSEQKQRDTPK